uniref:Uncharacterized protein n=1 Tax=Siphoviridae sp. ctDXu9 TaxID=2825387 RepID=A0A8S5VCY2_9CAUD|nr:MAG TPA: hypothetical protein [Siphoviridae sp. ctDXu9]
MLKEKLVIERKAATLITVDFTAPEIVGYAMAWLKLCNNARELNVLFGRLKMMRRIKCMYGVIHIIKMK